MRIEQNKTQREIAAYLGVSLGTVNRDIQVLNAHWREQASLDTQTLRAQQLAEIHQVKQYAWMIAPDNLHTLLKALRLEAQITGTILPPVFNFNVSVLVELARTIEQTGMTAGDAFEAITQEAARRKQREALGNGQAADGERVQMGQEIDAERHDHEGR
jgi:hypothetical protein